MNMIDCILMFFILFLILISILMVLRKSKSNIGVLVKMKEYRKVFNKIEFFEAVFRIIKCDSSTHYSISPEDSELRKELIEEYLFISKDFSKCQNYNPYARYQMEERCYKLLKNSCKEHHIFDDNIKPDGLENIIKLEYLGYLFFIVFHKHLIEKYRNDSDFNEMLKIESKIHQNNNLELNYYVKYPMIIFDKQFKSIIHENSYDIKRLEIDLEQINIEFMREEIKKIEFSCNYGGNYCFYHFRHYYITNFIDSCYSLMRKRFESEIKRIEESIEERLTDLWII